MEKEKVKESLNQGFDCETKQELKTNFLSITCKDKFNFKTFDSTIDEG